MEVRTSWTVEITRNTIRSSSECRWRKMEELVSQTSHVHIRMCVDTDAVRWNAGDSIKQDGHVQ